MYECLVSYSSVLHPYVAEVFFATLKLFYWTLGRQKCLQKMTEERGTSCNFISLLMRKFIHISLRVYIFSIRVAQPSEQRDRGRSVNLLCIFIKTDYQDRCASFFFFFGGGAQLTTEFEVLAVRWCGMLSLWSIGYLCPCTPIAL